ncbi:MAG: hypothetical protein Q8P67_15755 [archaeon]|nr:hypothetical protein [archaeon]
MDHNREKGLTHRLATEAGLRTARLPIDKFLQIEGRKVLAVNHVLQILVGKHQDQSWQTAFQAAIPQRRNFAALQETEELSPETQSRGPSSSSFSSASASSSS